MQHRHLRTDLAHAAAFCAALAIIAWLYDYPRIAPLGPTSNHAWRQADGASLALNYAQNGMRLFEPQLHNLFGGEGRAAGELPLLNYAVAALYLVVGHEHAVYRWFNFAVLAAGLFLSSRALLRWTGDPWLALFPPLLLLGSPLIAFYGFGFLPNTTAFGLILIAAYAYLRFAATARRGWLYAAAVFASLAGLTKISALIPFLAIAATTAVFRRFDPAAAERSGLPSWRDLVLASALVLGVNAAWYAWAQHYNALHGSSYFLLETRPLWELPASRIWEDALFLLFRQRRWYFHGAVLLALASLGAVLLVSRHLPPVPRLYLRLCAAGSAAFLLLFFGQLRVHEYYSIDVLPLAVSLLGLGAWLIATRMPRLARSAVFRFALVLLLSLNLQHATARMRRLYNPARIDDAFASLDKRAELQQFTADLGIDRGARALVLGDASPNRALYSLDLRGWSHAGHHLGPAAFAQYAERGVRFLVVLAPSRADESAIAYPGARPIATFDGRIRFYEITPPEHRAPIHGR